MTLTELLAQVRADLDIEEETFWSDADITRFANMAIRDLEAEVHTLFQDYFIVPTSITLISGTSDYSLPTDIFANFIRKIFYIKGDEKYEIRRIRNIEDVYDIESDEDYQYYFKNETTGKKIVLCPTPAEAGAYVKIWYIRQAKRLATGSDTIDLPESENFIVERTKYYCLEKDQDVRAQLAEGKAQEYLKRLVETLSEMVQDQNDELMKDFNYYNDSV